MVHSSNRCVAVQVGLFEIIEICWRECI